jgi:site-specific DNA recombinase
MVKAVGYIRVSTDQQDFERQRQEIIQYAKKQDFMVVHIFEDKQSGSDYEDRAGFQSLLAFLDTNPDVKVVIFDEVSRMGRDTAHQVITYKQLTKKGVRIFTRGKGEFGNNKEDSLLFTVLSAIADYEKQTIIDRTSSGRRQVVKEGFTQISNKPYGYNVLLTQKKDRKVLKRQFIEINDTEAEAVRQMFKIIDEGGTVFDIRRYLKKNNIRPSKGGEIWGQSSILRILHNSTYYGEWKFGKMVKNGKTKYSLSRRRDEDLITVKVPPIIDKPLYDRVQQSLLKRKSVLNPRNFKHVYLLQGITTCDCGHSVSCFFEGKTRKRTYRCPQRNIKDLIDKTCPIKSIQADYIEQILLLELKKKMAEPQAFENIRKEELKQRQTPVTSLTKQIDVLNVQVSRQDVLLKGYYEKAIAHAVDNPEKAKVFEKLADDLLNDQRQKKTQIEELKAELDTIKHSSIDFTQLRQVKAAIKALSEEELRDFNQDNQQKKLAFVRKYIKRIELKYLPNETDSLRAKIRALRQKGFYKPSSKHIRALYRTVFNKEHQLRAKTAAQVLAIQVTFVNNYSLPIEFVYSHEMPEMIISYMAALKPQLIMKKKQHEQTHYQTSVS